MPHPSTWTSGDKLNRRSFLAAVATALPATYALADAQQQPPGVPLAEDGQPRLPIIAGSVKEPVIELQHHLKQITGADFAVEKPAEKAAGLYVGLAADFPSLKLDLPAELGGEGFLLKTADSRVLLLAREAPGVHHAVTTFLYKLGCRWFFPGSTWEVIPKQKTISVSLDERQSPSFPISRHIWHGFGDYAPCARDFKEWNHHNRMGGPSAVSIGHSWFGLNHEKEFKTHPEWFALVNGQRKASKPCYSHPDVIKQGIRHGLEHAAAGAAMVSVSPPDGLGFCECERCLAVCQKGETFTKHLTKFAKRPDGVVVSVPSETVFHFANEVAAAVAEKYPKTLIGCMAYSAYSHPPSFKLHPNVFLQVTTAYRRTDLTLEEQLAAFKKQGCQAGIRDYFSVYQWDWDATPPGKKLAPDKLRDYLRNLQKNGVVSINAEASNNWGPRGLTYYLAAQLTWDLNAEPKVLLRDFYDKAFGPAAEPMERYYIHWYGAGAAGTGEAADETGDAREEAVEGQRLKLLFGDLDEGARRAKDRPDCLARIDHLRMYAHYLLLRQRTQQAAKTKDDKAILEAVKNETLFGARLTYTNMIHSRPLLGKAFLRRFKQFEKLLASVPEAQADNKGWRKVTQPPSHADLEQLWAEDKTALGLK
jgi:hypothetical protein